MPQMSPLLWSNLFLFFSIMFLISMMKLYFFTLKPLSLELKMGETSSQKEFLWVW